MILWFLHSNLPVITSERHTATNTIDLNDGTFQSNHYFITPFNIIFKYGF